MLESVYITLTLIAFFSFFASLILDKEKMLSKLILSGFAMILFAALAMLSTQIEVVNCDKISINSTVSAGGNHTTYVNDTQCTRTSYFYDENLWIFWSFSIFSLLVFMLFTWLLLLELKGGTI